MTDTTAREPLPRNDVHSGGAAKARSSVLDSYIAKFARAKSSRYLDFPYCVHLEISTLCPAACNFCPYPALERKFNVMPQELIDKILAELEAIPSDLPFFLFPCKVSDPFADRRLLSVLADVNKRLPNARICLLTNGLMLSESKFRGLLELTHVEFLSVALNDHRLEAYEQLMGASLAKTLSNLDRVHQIAAVEGFPPFPVVVSRVEDGTVADQEFVSWVRDRYPLFGVVLYPRSVWGGQVDTFNSQPIPDAPCLRWFDLSITSTGKVSFCCMDGKSEWAIGDVTVENSLAVYNTPSFKRNRVSVASRKDQTAPEPCRNCTILGYDKNL